METARYRPGSRANLDKHLRSLDKPGQHLWVMTGAWHIADPASAFDGTEKILDLENLVAFTGPGCYKCEKPYSAQMAKRPCLGSLDDVMP